MRPTRALPPIIAGVAAFVVTYLYVGVTCVTFLARAAGGPLPGTIKACSNSFGWLFTSRGDFAPGWLAAGLVGVAVAFLAGVATSRLPVRTKAVLIAAAVVDGPGLTLLWVTAGTPDRATGVPGASGWVQAAFHLTPLVLGLVLSNRFPFRRAFVALATLCTAGVGLLSAEIVIWATYGKLATRGAVLGLFPAAGTLVLIEFAALLLVGGWIGSRLLPRPRVTAGTEHDRTGQPVDAPA